MSFHGNKTVHATTDTSTKGQTTLLWIPYVGIAVLCLGFLAVNFWCYHRKHRQRYQRKAEVLETRERVIERRILLNLIKSRHNMRYGEDSADESSVCSTTVLSRYSNDVVDL